MSAKDFEELLGGRPGWRLEPRSTPGAGPLWCFVFNGKIEYSVTVDRGIIHLYVMDTDQEIVFADADELMGHGYEATERRRRRRAAEHVAGEATAPPVHRWS